MPSPTCSQNMYSFWGFWVAGFAARGEDFGPADGAAAPCHLRRGSAPAQHPAALELLPWSAGTAGPDADGKQRSTTRREEAKMPWKCDLFGSRAHRSSPPAARRYHEECLSLLRPCFCQSCSRLFSLDFAGGVIHEATLATVEGLCPSACFRWTFRCSSACSSCRPREMAGSCELLP